MSCVSWNGLTKFQPLSVLSIPGQHLRQYTSEEDPRLTFLSGAELDMQVLARPARSS